MEHINITTTDTTISLVADEGYYITSFQPEDDPINYHAEKQVIIAKTDDISKYRAVSQMEDGLMYVKKRSRQLEEKI